jgi:Icc-related predicted phosphoesterase
MPLPTDVARVAVLSDIHGVLPALEAVLAEPDVVDADLIVLTGDITASISGLLASQAARLDASRSGSRSTGRRVSTSTSTVP